ncbi:hypothetical protein EGW08_009778 [Elysia chlorotica]|uniref:Neurotransmitter-gated ion-channel transmembrane domain-containing protein n=1 Tax=Elysia chlorotica TaxID=188477 RepID=A0A3S1C443_ELYCH|nr:hypothetical protein EGW08_009778 [Elysia chlorotica]
MSMGMTVLLAYAVYLTIVSDYLPNTSVQTSIVAVYLTTLLGLTAVGILFTTYILRVHHRSAGSRVDERTQQIVRFLRLITCSLSERDKQLAKNSVSPEDSKPHDKTLQVLNYMNAAGLSRGDQQSTAFRRSTRTSDLDGSTGTDQRSSRNQPDLAPERPVSCPPVYEDPMTWQDVADVYDWFLFVFFTSLTTLLTITVLVILPVGGNSRAPTLNKTLV